MNLDTDEFTIDFDDRLLDLSFEIYALEDHLELIEKQIKHLRKIEHDKLMTFIKKEKLTPDDPEWHEAHQNFDHRFDLLLPRVFRGPFLVALYAVFESAVTEIAGLIQKSSGQSLALSDLRGNFLDRPKKYYKDILHFDLCNDKEVWARIEMLAKLRHALAHANGRVEMLKKESRKEIKKMEKQVAGIEDFNGFLVFSSEFMKETFDLVRSSLEDLVKRYKEWDSKSQHTVGRIRR